MICSCGGNMIERVEDKKPYHLCSSCGRVYAPDHRTEGAPVRWADNKDQSGVMTFLLTGETEIDGPTMRKRVMEYYAQYPRYSAERQAPAVQRPAPKLQGSLLDPAPPNK